jgi:hypothetical protein
MGTKTAVPTGRRGSEQSTAEAGPRGGRRRFGRYPSAVTPDDVPHSTLPPVRYKGEPLEARRGPGLGCFWLQLVALGVLVVLTPLSVNIGWPDWASAALLFATIALLLLAGQTIIFLLRLVAADRRAGRRRPVAARTRTVGELEDAQRDDDATAETRPPAAPVGTDPPPDQRVRE